MPFKGIKVRTSYAYEFIRLCSVVVSSELPLGPAMDSVKLQDPEPGTSSQQTPSASYANDAYVGWQNTIAR